ncbi:MAG: hypothetical protein LBR95_02220 [Azoarcus sp.]|jgi:hypothetical protein|nr:hypothetical protein [Azoarcus sp.]
MSLEGKSLHIRIAPDMHTRLAVLAGERKMGLAEYAAQLLEKTIVGEFHALSVQAALLEQLGLIGNGREAPGKCKERKP